MVKLELLSPNLIIILNELIKNQNIVKYLYYNQKNPLSQSNLTLPATNLMFDKVFPYPFFIDVETEEGSQIRVYYPKGRIEDGRVIEDTMVYVDILVAKTLWLVNDGEAKIRPYEMMKEIINHFYRKPIGTLGSLTFDEFTHLTVNDKFSGVRLEGKMITLGK